MNSASRNSGTLWIVATPIGNLDDMSPRAVRVLEQADVIAAEDTRHTGRLLGHFGIRTKQVSLHEHNERQRVPDLVGRLADGETIALVSDAGTPLVSDPGYRLVRAAREAGMAVYTVPGPCAAVAALSIAGLPTDRFRFEGFLPPKAGARDRKLEALKRATETLVFYETPQRIPKTLHAMSAAFGAEREAVLCRELTKLHETVLAGTLGSLITRLEAEPGQLRGEMVLIVNGDTADADRDGRMDEGRRLFELLREEMTPGKAAKLAAAWSGCRRRDFYE